eukprot:2322339-Rhodomonas_salina.4
MVSLVSDTFIAVAGVLTCFMLGIPILSKVVHLIRAQVRKMLLAINDSEEEAIESDTEGSEKGA